MIEIWEETNQIQIIGHFDGYICGLLTTLCKVVNSGYIKGEWNQGYFLDGEYKGELNSIITFEIKKDFLEWSGWIEEKVEQYGKQE